MAFKIVQWNSRDKVCCDQTLPTDVVLCVDPDKVAQKSCLNGGETDFPWATIDAQLLEFYVLTNDCNPCPIFRYSIRYDDTQIVDQQPLTSADVLGLICASCLVSFIRSTAGNEVTFTQNEDGSVTITSQHGCSFTFNPAGIDVEDTESIDLHLVGSTLSGDVNISATSGNQISILPDGLFVPDLSGLTVDDTDSVDLTLTGDVLTADVNISPDSGNQIVVHGNGLFVDRGAGLTVSGTQSINLNNAGGLLSADLKISADAGNQAVLAGDGLFVPPDFIQSVSDTTSVDLDVTGSVLTAIAVISGNGGNILVNDGSGLYVPTPAADFIQSISNTTTVDLDVTANVLTANVNLCNLNTDGWVPACEEWTVTGTNILTVPSDATLKYSIGDKIRLTQTATTKYFYVIDVAPTALTLTGGDDYSVSVIFPITDFFFSKAVTPVGFPQHFYYLPTFTGFSVDPATPTVQWSLFGTLARLIVSTGEGTSNSTDFRVSLLVPVATTVNPLSCQAGGFDGTNNSIFVGNILAIINPGVFPNDVLLLTGGGATTWTALGNKAANFNVCYNIA